MKQRCSALLMCICFILTLFPMADWGYHKEGVVISLPTDKKTLTAMRKYFAEYTSDKSNAHEFNGFTTDVSEDVALLSSVVDVENKDNELQYRLEIVVLRLPERERTFDNRQIIVAPGCTSDGLEKVSESLTGYYETQTIEARHAAGDDKINSRDAVLIQQYAVKIPVILKRGGY